MFSVCLCVIKNMLFLYICSYFLKYLIFNYQFESFSFIYLFIRKLFFLFKYILRLNESACMYICAPYIYKFINVKLIINKQNKNLTIFFIIKMSATAVFEDG